MATWIVNHFGEKIEVHGVEVNPIGYQNVLYVTLALYVIALIICCTMVGRKKKEA